MGVHVAPSPHSSASAPTSSALHKIRLRPGSPCTHGDPGSAGGRRSSGGPGAVRPAATARRTGSPGQPFRIGVIWLCAALSAASGDFDPEITDWIAVQTTSEIFG